ncbi:MAG: hypothetical protein P8X58_02555 [Syntrophobacterales bacterium]
MAVKPFRLYLKAPGEKRRPPRSADAVVHLGKPGTTGACLHHNFQNLWPLPEKKQEPVQAFLLLALGAWAADKLAPRSLQPDAWTRNLALEIPFTLNWAALAPRLEPLLNFLTGDTWTLQPRELQTDIKFGPWLRPWRSITVLTGCTTCRCGCSWRAPSSPCGAAPFCIWPWAW